MKRRLPALPEPFPPPFLLLLEQILRQAGRIRGARSEAVRARHRALQQSGTFAGHRAYSPGDDLRRLDWNAAARTGQLFTKVFEEDERRATTIVLDTSPSMLAGEPPRLLAALRLAAILGGLALVHLDEVHLRAGDAGATSSGRAAVPELLQRLRTAPARTEDPFEAATALLRHGAPGKVHWISDFAEPRRYELALHALRRSGCRVVGWLPTIAADAGLEPGGWTLAVDPETGDELRVAVDRAFCVALRRELQILRRQQQQVFAACGFPLQCLQLPTDEFTIARWLEAGWSFRR